MKLYSENSNLTAFQVTQAVSCLQFRIKKTTPAATLGDFLAGDTLKMTYSSAGQQNAICSTLPFDMLFHYSSMWNGVTKVVVDSTGKVTEVLGCVEVGFGGSVPLSTDKHLLIETNISGLANVADDKSLEVYAVSSPVGMNPVNGQAVPIALTTYDFINLLEGQQTQTDISQATALVLTPVEKDVTFTDKTGSAYVQSIRGLAVLAEKLNENAAMYGKYSADKASIVGKQVEVKKAFRASGVEPGGVRYIGIDVTNFASMQIVSALPDGFLRVTAKMLQ